jgi:hypothetical protein
LNQNFESMMLREESETVPCPRCHAPIGERCRSTINREPMRVPHWQRIRAIHQEGK